MRTRMAVLVPVLCLFGCASTPQVVQAPPIPDDIPWSRPRAVDESTPPPLTPAERPPTPHERVFTYEEGKEWKVDVGLDVPLNIWLQPGEVYDLVQSGYRRPVAPGEDEKASTWEIQTAQSGEGASQRWHVTVTVSRPGLTNGLDIITNRHVYTLLLRSVEKAKHRIVRWTYPHEAPPAEAKQPRLLPDPTEPQAYHVGYTREEGPTPTWEPRQVLDDGHKTYILLPTNVHVMDMPMVRRIGATGPELTNPLRVGSVIVLDGIPRGVELRVGAGETAEVSAMSAARPCASSALGPPSVRSGRHPPTLPDARSHPRDTTH